MSTFCFTSKSGNIPSNLRSMITRSFLSPSLFNSSNWGVVRVLRRRREPAMVPRFSTAKGRGPMATKAVIFFSVVLILCALFSTRWINNAFLVNTTTGDDMVTTENLVLTPTIHHDHKPKPRRHRRPAIIPFSCPTGRNLTNVCASAARPSRLPPLDDEAMTSCPDYFRWIHEDLKPWKSKGITREMVHRAALTANFRLVVVGGRVYIENYQPAFQTRDVFTIWGIIQLLRLYPGRLPDLDIMFDCVDWPVVKASDYNATVAPPPLFRYCGDNSTLDIVFPDWSFWGWPEINIKPWEALSKELKAGNERTKWMDRDPYAYWKGNPEVSPNRQDLLQCNVSADHDWNARIYAQDWASEIEKGFKDSDLASQCRHRYKIYIEGSAWSVSEKYILACDSVSLVVRPRYYDFFTRGLMPVHHYWPIRNEDKCRSIKYAVDWGNSHKQKAQAIGKEASNFIQEQLKMDYVYDYMFHLLNEYGKLLRYKPTIPRKALEICSESMACPSEGTQRKFMMESMVRAPRDSAPCSLPRPYSSQDIKMMHRRKDNSLKQVEIWEQKAWKSQKL